VRRTSVAPRGSGRARAAITAQASSGRAPRRMAAGAGAPSRAQRAPRPALRTLL
jgi:hypothetical protein